MTQRIGRVGLVIFFPDILPRGRNESSIPETEAFLAERGKPHEANRVAAVME